MPYPLAAARGGHVTGGGAAAPTLPALVQQKVATAADGAISLTLDAPATPGNSLIACYSYLAGDGFDQPPSTGSTGTMNLAVSSAGASGVAEIWYLHNILSGDEVLASTSGGGTIMSVNIQEWSGLSNAVPSATNTNSGVASTAVTTGSVTPAAHNLIVAMYASVLNSYISGPTLGFTALTATGGTGAFQREGYIIQSAATAKNPAWTISLDNWCACIAAFGAP